MLKEERQILQDLVGSMIIETVLDSKERVFYDSLSSIFIEASIFPALISLIVKGTTKEGLRLERDEY